MVLFFCIIYTMHTGLPGDPSGPRSPGNPPSPCGPGGPVGPFLPLLPGAPWGEKGMEGGVNSGRYWDVTNTLCLSFMLAAYPGSSRTSRSVSTTCTRVSLD